ncbi:MULTISPECIES: 3-oxoadipate enol-lactonase [unclassified Embleya]|uniref:3-oxoadipate enol-lactonase n=1 Tax=unclassified Embleya TaxID=2699296 RepID=UPI0033D551C7
MTIATLNHRFDGPADAPVLILGPSLGSELGMWDAQIPELSRHHRVLRYDLRGHGTSHPVPGTASVGDLVGDVLTLADSYGIKRFAYAGISLGGAVGLWMGVHHSERLTALVSCSSSARFGEPEPWLERAATVRSRGMRELADTVIRRWFTPEYATREPAEVRRILDMLYGCPPEGYAGCCEALARYDLRSELGRIDVPTLVIGAERDPSTPIEQARELAAGISGATLVEVGDAAHLVNIQQAEVVTSAISAHVAAGRAGG